MKNKSTIIGIIFYAIIIFLYGILSFTSNFLNKNINNILKQISIDICIIFW